MGTVKSEVIKLLPEINASKTAVTIMEGWPRVLLFELAGEDDFTLVIEQGKMSLAETKTREPDIIMQGDADELVQVFNGHKDITHPLAHGRLRLRRGKSIELVIFLSRILGAVQRKKKEAH